VKKNNTKNSFFQKPKAALSRAAIRYHYPAIRANLLTVKFEVPKNASFVKERKKTIPLKLKRISEEISNAIQEAKKIRELTIQEEVVQELDKVNASLEGAKKEIAKILNP
jgi:hypothetical protein